MESSEEDDLDDLERDEGLMGPQGDEEREISTPPYSNPELEEEKEPILDDILHNEGNQDERDQEMSKEQFKLKIKEYFENEDVEARMIYIYIYIMDTIYLLRDKYIYIYIYYLILGE